MIDSALQAAMADRRLIPMEKNVLTALHAKLDYYHFRPVKVATLADLACCSRARAFRALNRLEVLGYLHGDPKTRKPKHYRLTAPLSLTTATSQAA